VSGGALGRERGVKVQGCMRATVVKYLIIKKYLKIKSELMV
jgi:hypothetical protein